MLNAKRTAPVAVLVVIAAAPTVGAGGCEKKGGDSNDSQSTGGSGRVQEDTHPPQLQVDADGDTTCNPKGGKVTITSRGLTPQAPYKVEAYTPLLRDHGERVKRGSAQPDASGRLSTSFSCKGQKAGAYEVIVTDPNTAAKGSDAFDVYSVVK